MTAKRRVFGARLGSMVLGAVIGVAPLAQARDNGAVKNATIDRHLFQQHIGVPINPALRAPGASNADVREWFIRLSAPSVAEFNVMNNKTGATMSRGAQSTQARRVDMQQAGFRRHLDKMGIEVTSALRVGANGLRVRATAADIPALRKLPGVLSVAPMIPHEIELAASVGWIGAPAVWESFGTAEGVSIAIIDTGIDYLHANFGGSGDVDEYNANDKSIVEEGTFPTAKVVGGRDFAGAVYDASNPLTSIPIPDDDPLDGNGHGSHVGGISAGLGVEGILHPGVAPGADLYALKVFGDTGGSTNLTSDAIEWAMDPNGDGSMDDHLDVINMSLGSSFGHPNDPSSIATQNAVENGIIVAASAGNSSDVPYITGAPAVAVKAISVASSLSGGQTKVALDIDTEAPGMSGRYAAEEGDGETPIALNARNGLLVPSESPTDDGTGNPVPGSNDDLACLPLTNGSTMRGKIALVSRGFCTFLLKFQHAQAAGAIAIVVHNDGTDPDRVDPIPMGGIDGSVFIPGLMISSTDGFALRDAIEAGHSMQAAIGPDINVPAPAANADTLSGFSSRGPGHGGSSFKPNLSAPGDGIVSTAVGSGTGSVALSGTSMAAPHIAGTAALLHAKFPTLDPLWIKAMLQNTSVPANIDGPDSNTPYPLSLQGTGVVRVDLAAELSSAALPGGVTFGRINPVFHSQRDRRIGVRNMSLAQRNYTVTHVPNRGMDGVTVTCPGDISVPPAETLETTIRLEIDPTAGPADDGSFSQSEVDGWCIFDDGEDVLRVGYLAVVDPASKINATAAGGEIHIGNSGPSMGWAEGFTLAGLDGEHLDDADNAIAAFGFRHGDADAFGLEVIEFAIAVERRWEAMSNLEINIYVDSNEDGIEDVLLQTTDGSVVGLPAGSMVTGQYPLDAEGEPGDGFLDWFVALADYNDAVAALPFSNDPASGFAFLEEGDTNFNYRLEIFARDGSVDEQFGSIDLSHAMAPESASMGLMPFEATSVAVDGSGDMLWLFQNNGALAQWRAVSMD